MTSSKRRQIVSQRSYLSPPDGDPAPHLDDEVTLQCYRLQSVYEGSIDLQDEVGELNNSPRLGMPTEDERERLSKILGSLNERWGTEFTHMDKVLEQVAEDLAEDKEITEFAHNSLDLFKPLYDDKMDDVMLKRMTQNHDFVLKYLSEKAFRADVDAILLPMIHDRLNRNGKEDSQSPFKHSGTEQTNETTKNQEATDLLGHMMKPDIARGILHETKEHDLSDQS